METEVDTNSTKKYTHEELAVWEHLHGLLSQEPAQVKMSTEDINTAMRFLQMVRAYSGPTFGQQPKQLLRKRLTRDRD